MELTVEIVKAARELISAPEHWGKGTYAAERKNEYDRMRDAVPIHDPHAICYCGLGAIRKAALNTGVSASSVENQFIRAVYDCVPEDYRGVSDGEQYARFTHFNDSPATTHEQVLGAFDCLIAKMEGGK